MLSALRALEAPVLMSVTMLKTRDLIDRGWTANLVKTLLREPDKIINRGYYRTFFYDESRVYKIESENVALSASVARHRVEKVKVEEKQKREHAARDAKYIASYGSRDGAVPAACYLLFHSNRIAKRNRDKGSAIYAAKGRLIKYLYLNGYSTSVQIHRRERIECEWMENFSEKFACFRFDVAGQTYCWHQPVTQLNFKYTATASDQPWQERGPSDVIADPQVDIDETVDLIDWVTTPTHESNKQKKTTRKQ